MTRYINGLVFNSETRSFNKQSFQVQGQYFAPSSTTSEIDIDLDGYYITPGLIDSCSQIGLAEIGIRWEGDDSYEFDSHLDYSVVDGIYPFDAAFQKAISHGVTASHIVPSPKSLVGAKTAIIHHTHTTVDEMVIAKDIAYSFSIGHQAKSIFFAERRKPLTRMGIAKILRETLQQIQQQEPLIKKIVIRAHKAVDLEFIDRLQQEFKSTFDFHIIHGTEASLLQGTSFNTVIAGPTFRYIEHNEMMALSPKLYRQLSQQHTPFVFCTDHPVSSTSHLTLEGCLAVREGLTRQDVLYALTTGAANFLGIAHKTGTIRDGLLADFVIWDKHPLNLDAQVVATFIKGTKVYAREEGFSE
ncbi:MULTISPECIES: amidohydrolase family protein [unclassified Lysinibacillus]|uniref:amidohydrolase family protein n=1 Tax=unclassified Lysinibacillus TaxID=2636778 RepID=UPI00088B2131|nr:MULTISPECIES: amidohydrolase family protein [unclassified Lysinibacillus]SCZ02527.1 Imidazolonepropionase [Lysinibacillus sp. SG9]SDB27902.1 Imidazolonepropionase [Lysinibacillus sp. TC-37]SFS88282.1 Imidazolonepropionase [Lysinibacillus sp. SG55]